MSSPKFISIIDAENESHLINVNMIIDVVEITSKADDGKMVVTGGKIILNPNVTIHVTPGELSDLRGKLSGYSL